VIDFACKDLEKRDTDNPKIAALACAYPVDSFPVLVTKNLEADESSNESAKKWAFVSAAFALQ